MGCTPTAGGVWSYHGDTGPTHWKDIAEDCAKMKQSPINIVTNDVKYDSTLAAFTLTNFAKSASHTLKNNGHTVQVDVGDHTMEVTGGSLGGTYQVAQFHFHWGANGNSGSEHTINGKAYPLEVHIFSKTKQEINLHCLNFFHFFSGKNTTIPSTSLLQFIYQTSMKRYYRYKGSLTTPPCYESVTWTVFEDTIKISSAQLAKFRMVYQDAGNTVIDMNYRPIQPLNGRDVKASFHTGVSSSQQVLYNCWSYEGSKGPSYWYKDYADCGEKSQSPINLPSDCDLEYNQDLGPFILSGFLDKTPINTLKNNGHASKLNIFANEISYTQLIFVTVQVDVTGHLTVTGGGLPGTHKVAQFHFHWGEDDSRGSEHFQNGIQYPLEVTSSILENWMHLHIVTYNMKYPDLTTAVDKADVISFSHNFMHLFSGNSTSVSDLKVRYLLPNKFSKFYRYKGSLTTPPCYESVTWTVFQETIYLSTEQVSMATCIINQDKIINIQKEELKWFH
ncbi:hypothetical protein KUTeg_016626 [Tegillarca granosa]|uniref:carbonic anhydrase n=1 Tax=Tegillarca granosa TaxID=220873 RepID=A0ABQ9ELF6_TEGGR|nr:hypothetical protein KUTeg_016626 [Tegillarca granosa]